MFADFSCKFSMSLVYLTSWLLHRHPISLRSLPPPFCSFLLFLYCTCTTFTCKNTINYDRSSILLCSKNTIITRHFVRR